MMRSTRGGGGGGRKWPRENYHNQDAQTRDKNQPVGPTERENFLETIRRLENGRKWMKDELARFKKQIKERNGKIATLEAAHETDARLNEQQQQLLDFGTRALRELRSKGDRLQEAEEQLQQRVMEVENNNNYLNDLVAQMPEAMGDEFTGLALEAQARRTLSMVSGLQDEVAQKDATIDHLQAALAEKDAIIASKERKVAELLEKMRTQFQEREEASKDQQKLIDRLLAGRSA